MRGVIGEMKRPDSSGDLPPNSKPGRTVARKLVHSNNTSARIIRFLDRFATWERILFAVFVAMVVAGAVMIYHQTPEYARLEFP